MMIKSVVGVAITSLLVTVVPVGSSGFAMAEPGSQVAGSPAVLLPHADPRPIPDIDSYHVVTDTKRYEVHDKDGRLLGMQFSTPDGALCGLNIDLLRVPGGTLATSCISKHFPQRFLNGQDGGVIPNDKILFYAFYLDNVEEGDGYYVITDRNIRYYGKGINIWSQEMDALDDVDAGRTPPGFPVLPAGNILSFTPNDPYITGNKATPLPVACAVGFNHVVWCASHALIELHYAGINTYSTVIPKDKLKPKGFYVSPEKAVFYEGYNDPGTVKATK